MVVTFAFLILCVGLESAYAAPPGQQAATGVEREREHDAAQYLWGRDYFVSDLTGIVIDSKGRVAPEISLIYFPFLRPASIGSARLRLYVPPGFGGAVGTLHETGQTYYEWEYAQPLMLVASGGHSGALLGIVATYGEGFFRDDDGQIGRTKTASITGGVIFLPTPTFYRRTIEAPGQKPRQEFGVMLKIPFVAINNLWF